MWAYGHLPNQTIRSESAWLSVLFSQSRNERAGNMCVRHFYSRVMCTDRLGFVALLAYRIWSIDRQVQASGARSASQSRLNPVVRIVMESGLANAAYLFVFVMTLEFGSQALEIMSEMVCLYFSLQPHLSGSN